MVAWKCRTTSKFFSLTCWLCNDVSGCLVGCRSSRPTNKVCCHRDKLPPLLPLHQEVTGPWKVPRKGHTFVAKSSVESGTRSIATLTQRSPAVFPNGSKPRICMRCRSISNIAPDGPLTTVGRGQRVVDDGQLRRAQCTWVTISLTAE
jgi:hypothetical protein